MLTNKSLSPISSSDELVNSDFLYENSPCGYLTFYPDGTIIKINQTLATWLQVEKETLYGKVKLGSLLSKGGRFYYEMVVLPLLQMQGFVNEINFEIKSSDDSFPGLFNASVVRNSLGEIIAINAIILNITDRKKYESLLLTARQTAEEERKRFEFLSNSVPNIIWTALPSGHVDFVNDRFYQVFGSKTSTVRFKSFLHLVYFTERKRAFVAWKSSVQTGNKFELEVRILTASQKHEWFLITAVPYTDLEGRVISWFGSFTNINVHKEQQQQTVEKLNDSLFAAGEEISKKAQTLREIAFDQSHLIRHPLTNILGITSIMKEMKMNAGLTQMVKMLETSAHQLDEVIKEIVYKTYESK